MLKIAWTAHAGADASMASHAAQIIKENFSAGSFEITDLNPDIILFMSGGSERRAIGMLKDEKPVLLLAIEGNNAYAAATEVMAWLVNRQRIAVISDLQQAIRNGLIGRWQKTIDIWSSLAGKRAGLIGSVSDWLVASDVPAEILRRVFDVTLVNIPWNSLPDFHTVQQDKTLVDRLAGLNPQGLHEAAQVLTVLRQSCDQNNLNAIGVECFSLVQQTKVTACLGLAQLNDEGFTAACEGDLASMAGMMLAQAATGTAPWMANTTKIAGNVLMISHCTAAFSLVSDLQLATHYETDCSLAVKGRIKADEVTVFRFSEKLDRAFIAEGKVTGHPEMQAACRTQVEITLTENEIRLLQEKPLGNHLVLVPGLWAEQFRLLCKYKGIEVIS